MVKKGSRWRGSFYRRKSDGRFVNYKKGIIATGRDKPTTVVSKFSIRRRTTNVRDRRIKKFRKFERKPKRKVRRGGRRGR